MFKKSVNKNNNQKLVDMLMTFIVPNLVYCISATVHELSIKQNVNFEINSLPSSYFWFFENVVIVYLPKVYHNIKFYGPTLTAASCASTAEA
jgi:hypothetical protein